MTKDPIENGKNFLRNVLGYSDEQIAQLPEDKIKVAGEHVLRQEDYSAGMNDVQTKAKLTGQWRAELETWKQKNDRELAEGRAAIERLKLLDARGGGNLPSGDPADEGKAKLPDLSGFVRKEDVDRLIADVSVKATSYATHVATVMSGLTAKHFQEFGAPLDTQQLLDYCREHNVQIDRGGYESFVSGLREEKAKKVHDDELKAAEERGRQRGLSESSSALPFPTSGGSLGLDGNHTLEGLGNKAYDKATAVERATATFREEQRARAGNGGAS